LSVVVSFRVPKDLKRKMDELRKYVNWSEELRKFIMNRIREIEQEIAIKELEEIIKKLPQSPKGTAVRYVREDRDRY
jgi:predicted transcriptional regulator